MRNRRRAQKFDPNIKKSVNLTKKIEKLRLNKDKILLAIKARMEKNKLKKLNKGKKTDDKKKKKPAKKAPKKK